MATTSERLKQLLDEKGISQAELAKRTGINKGALSSYISGRYKPKQNNTFLLAKALDVNEAWLMGADVSRERIGASPSNIPSYPNVHPLGTRCLPILGSVACGEPIFMAEEKEFYVDSTTDVHADFVLIAKGDSMTGARIYDGDIVFIRQQPEVENGEIAVVAIDDEATLKRFYKYSDDLIVLRAENPDYKDMVYTPEDHKDVRVLGKAVAFQSDVR